MFFFIKITSVDGCSWYSFIFHIKKCSFSTPNLIFWGGGGDIIAVDNVRSDLVVSCHSKRRDHGSSKHHQCYNLEKLDKHRVSLTNMNGGGCQGYRSWRGWNLGWRKINNSSGALDGWSVNREGVSSVTGRWRTYWRDQSTEGRVQSVLMMVLTN